MGIAYKILVGKPEGERPFGRLSRIWKVNIRIYLTETGWEIVDWMHLAQDRYQWWALVNTVMNLRVPWKARNFLTSAVTMGFSRRTRSMDGSLYSDRIRGFSTLLLKGLGGRRVKMIIHLHCWRYLECCVWSTASTLISLHGHTDKFTFIQLHSCNGTLLKWPDLGTLYIKIALFVSYLFIDVVSVKWLVRRIFNGAVSATEII